MFWIQFCNPLRYLCHFGKRFFLFLFHNRFQYFSVLFFIFCFSLAAVTAFAITLLTLPHYSLIFIHVFNPCWVFMIMMASVLMSVLKRMLFLNFLIYKKKPYLFVGKPPVICTTMELSRDWYNEVLLETLRDQETVSGHRTFKKHIYNIFYT